MPFPEATVASVIRFCAPLYPNWDRELEAQMLSRFGIDPKRRLKQHSQGQQRAVALLLAICPRPELLILDEPASNLDAVVRREFLDAVLSLAAEEGRTRDLLQPHPVRRRARRRPRRDHSPGAGCCSSDRSTI